MLLADQSQGRLSPSGVKQPLWTKDFAYASTVKLFTSISFSMLNTTLAVFALTYLNATASQAGALVGVFVGASVVSRIFAGRFVDLVGRKRMLTWSTGAFFLVSLAYLLPLGFPGYVIVRILSGLAFGASSNTLTVVVTSLIPEKRWGEGLGCFSLAATLANIVSPFTGILLLQRVSHIAMFAFCVVSAAAAFFAVCAMSIEDIELTEQEREGFSRGVRFSDFFAAAALRTAVLVLMLNMCYSSVSSFVNAYAVELGLGETSSLFFIAYALSLMIVRPIAGKILDKGGANATVYPAFVILVAGYLVLGTCSSSGALILGAILLAAGYGTVFFSIQAVTIKSVDSHHVGMATSTFYMCADAGLGFGPVLAGIFSPFVGFSGVYSGCAIASLAILALYFLLHGRKNNRGRLQLD